MAINTGSNPAYEPILALVLFISHFHSLLSPFVAMEQEKCCVETARPAMVGVPRGKIPAGARSFRFGNRDVGKI